MDGAPPPVAAPAWLKHIRTAFSAVESAPVAISAGRKDVRHAASTSGWLMLTRPVASSGVTVALRQPASQPAEDPAPDALQAALRAVKLSCCALLMGHATAAAGCCPPPAGGAAAGGGDTDGSAARLYSPGLSKKNTPPWVAAEF